MAKRDSIVSCTDTIRTHRVLYGHDRIQAVGHESCLICPIQDTTGVNNKSGFRAVISLEATLYTHTSCTLCVFYFIMLFYVLGGSPNVQEVIV